MGGDEGIGVTTGQPNLYKQDLSKLVSNALRNYLLDSIRRYTFAALNNEHI